ncbi:MAG: FtsW/RodA/SpoVE family cell cycle protein [Lachnospiraceae bacterium]|nr:FtsW/RodA/SpoVE family cell cycle protein [Lachnospiraceae bacterium]
MLRAVIELSKYILAFNILLYTLISFITLRRDDRERRGFVFGIQYVMIFINHMTGSLVLLSSRKDFTYLFLPLFQVITVFAFLVLMRVIYPRANRLIQNHIAMLLSISFVILTRLSLTRSIRQFAIVAVSLIIALIIPFFIKYIKLLKSCDLIFAAIGILVLGAVLISGSITNGSKLTFSILGISFQPSEFVKILYVLFIAAILSRAKHFGYIILSAVLAAIHVLLLAASKDLGSALIYFVTYIILLFVATRKLRYLISGLAGGAAAAYVSYFLFSHVRVRVAAWLDPWNDINATGYQIAQSLFGIGTGGWFGMGIDAGSPNSIPYVEQDFIFSAICEEYGLIFGICLIAICVNLFLEIVHAAHSCCEPFMKYAAYGLGIVYIVQIFLTIGGNSKFIPLTGVTLPLISYGGSSVLASLVMFSVIQGLYINNDLFWDGEYDDVLIDAAGQDDEYAENASYPAKLYMNIIAGTFSVLFAAISVYLVHFVYYDSPQVINNSYNAKRQDILAEKTIRGDIMSSDGQVLATTLVNSDARYYPFGEVFSHAVGYATNGKMGVEQSANTYLVSSNISLNDKLQDDLADKKHMGNTVVTTYDAKLQKIAYDALGLYDGAVIVTEPTTGRVLAMVSKPDFDPNTIDEIWDSIINDETSSVLLNRATQGLYPPGSTFKILTALEYIRENPDDYKTYLFNCTGRFVNGKDTINCFHGTKHGEVDFTRSFAKSCNSSFANIGLKLDRAAFEDTLESLYFNSELPVSFLAKKSSISKDIQTSDSVMLQTVIGQGATQVTPLQIAMITAMIANNGEMMIPYTIERVETADGTVIKQYTPTSLGQLITEEEAAALQELMSAVVEEGTGTRLSGQSYQAAGKTGSAEYNSFSDSHAWFTGYTYHTDKPLQITVIMEGAGSGGEYAVPVARRILDQYYDEN